MPEGRNIHNVFHVSCLKKAVGQQMTTSTELPPLDEEGQLVLIPKEILDVRERRLRRKVIREFLIRWRDLPVEDAMWEECNVPFQMITLGGWLSGLFDSRRP
jgi:hypothetical protein